MATRGRTSGFRSRECPCAASDATFGHPFAPGWPVLRRLATGWLCGPPAASGAPCRPRPCDHAWHGLASLADGLTGGDVLRRSTKHLAANSRSSRRNGQPHHPGLSPRSIAMCLPPALFLRAITSSPCSADHRSPCVAKNVCLVAPFRRPIPRATAGAIMGRFANSASCAMPVCAARSYDQRVASTDFCAELCRWSD